MLSREEIEEIAARFAEERHRFERVAGEVHRRTVDILNGRTLKNVVTSRAKTRESLTRSLWRDRENWSGAQFMERTLAPPLKDLAGVRVLLYREVDVEPARDALLTAFEPLQQKDKRSADKYSAYHMIVHNWCDAGDSNLAPLRRLPCEIQICTVVEHVWNELEHDIVYKQPDGSPDDGQVELLQSLRAELGLCVKTVGRLMERTEKRARQNDETMIGPHDLRRYLERQLDSRVDGPFDELWDFLSKLLDRITPRVLDGLLAQGRAEEDARAIRDQIDPDSAHREVGLVAVTLLPAFADEDVRDLIGLTPDAPLWKFLLRVTNHAHKGKL